MVFAACEQTGNAPSQTPTGDEMPIWEETPSPPDIQVSLGGQSVELKPINYEWTWNRGSGPENLVADSQHPLELNLDTLQSPGGELGISSEKPPASYFMRYWELTPETQNAIGAQNADYYENSFKNVETLNGAIYIPESEYAIVIEIAAFWNETSEVGEMGEARYALKLIK
jgi:hypothetical protein